MRTNGTSFECFADLYEIDNRDLFQVHSLEELKNQLKEFTNNQTL